MKKLWAQQEQEEKDLLVQTKVRNKQARAKADEYFEVQRLNREQEEQKEKAEDVAFVRGVLERERKLSEKEEAEKLKARKKAVEFTEALKIEMAHKAASEEELIKLQQEESERQWAKRYAQWEKEEIARRGLMVEVYSDRAEQVRLKQDVRDRLKEDVGRDRDRMDNEVGRLEAIEAERGEGERMVMARHQEELFRQMDYHQVQRHRQLQQHAIEQRQAAISEEKIRRAVKAEKEKSRNIMKNVLENREQAKMEVMVKSGIIPPWEK